MPTNISKSKTVWLGWIVIAVIYVSLIMLLFSPLTNKQIINFTGLFFQIFGIVTVLQGMSKTRRHFGLPSFTSNVKIWINRHFPFLRRKPAHYEVTTTSSVLVGSKLRSHRRHKLEENATPETHFKVIEKDINSIHERIDDVEKEMDEEFRKTADNLNREKELRQQEDRKIQENLKSMATGDIHIDEIGTIILLLGVILSTACEEISSLFISHDPFL